MSKPADNMNCTISHNPELVTSFVHRLDGERIVSLQIFSILLFVFGSQDFADNCNRHHTHIHIKSVCVKG